VKAQAVGYVSLKKAVTVVEGKTAELKFDLKEDLIGIEQVIVSASKHEQNRKEAVTVVNAITPKIFESTQSAVVGEALNFTPGLRLENNCQNCGFTQIRMNGMEGSYSQILINSRPIMSGLAGVYGLEMFPTNMIERIEVVRGGGSALFGSNAIAGTVNLITKDPIKSGFEFGANNFLTGIGVDGTGGMAMENSVNFNASVVDHEAKGGVTAFGYVRDRQGFDANNDGFTEASTIKNTTLGAKAFHRTGSRGKVSFDYFHIDEKRRGGDAFDKPVHVADIAEALEHDIHSASVTFDQLFNDYDKLSIFGSGQYVDRGAYYGAEQDATAYGSTEDMTYSVGAQLNMFRDKLFFAPGNIVAGIENQGGFLTDEKQGYIDGNGDITSNLLIADQQSITTGAFVQGEWELERLKANIGVRSDYYTVKDLKDNNSNEGLVISPRVSLKYALTNYFSVRGSYSQGYKAPQIYDEDLHIETSGLHKVIHENDPNLKQEESRSYMLSLAYDRPLGDMQSQFLVEGFRTQLINAFANNIGDPDANGVVTYTRINAAEGAFVQGVNVEWTLAPARAFMTRAGFTLQNSMYNEVQDWGSKKFLRTPSQYGFVTVDYDFYKGFCLSATGNYTGSMKVLYEGIEEKSGLDENNILDSESFVDLGMKLSYDIKLNGTTLQLSTGIKNILNAYQSNFDSGKYRDPAFVYGPGQARTVFFGLKFSNF
jgi:outer membrane receptor for ferrienterochelin and colicins